MPFACFPLSYFCPFLLFFLFLYFSHSCAFFVLFSWPFFLFFFVLSPPIQFNSSSESIFHSWSVSLIRISAKQIAGISSNGNGKQFVCICPPLLVVQEVVSQTVASTLNTDREEIRGDTLHTIFMCERRIHNLLNQMEMQISRKSRIMTWNYLHISWRGGRQGGGRWVIVEGPSIRKKITANDFRNRLLLLRFCSFTPRFAGVLSLNLIMRTVVCVCRRHFSNNSNYIWDLNSTHLPGSVSFPPCHLPCKIPRSSTINTHILKDK